MIYRHTCPHCGQYIRSAETPACGYPPPEWWREWEAEIAAFQAHHGPGECKQQEVP